MPTSAATYIPPTGHSVVTLSGTIETDAQFGTQPTADDQVVYPSALTVDAQLNISGPPGSYVLWHVRSAGLIVHTEYDIVNADTPVLSGQTTDQITATSLRFGVQTTKSGGTRYFKIGTSMPSDGDTLATGVTASVPSAGVLTHTFTGLSPSTLYYIKAVHVDADDNVSNYVSASQATLASGSISSPVVYSAPAGYVVATLEAGYDTYALQGWQEVIDDEDLSGSQLVTPDQVTYFDSLGNLYFDDLDDSPFLFITPAGVVHRLMILNKDGLASSIPLSIPNQTVSNCEADTWINMPDQVVLSLGAGVEVSALMDNTLAQMRVSTDNGSTFDAFSATARTGLVDGDILEYRIMSGAHYANSTLGSDYTRSASPSVAGVSFTITANNRNAVVPTITVHPLTQTVDPGDPVTLSVTANTGGLADPITYQWAKGGINISGATSSSYPIASAVIGDAGSYTVRLVSAEGGAVVSNAAVLSVSPNSNVYIETEEGLVNINALNTLLVNTEVDYEIWADGVLALSGTATTHPTTAKLRIESVDTVIGPAASQVELRLPIDGSPYFHGVLVTVQAG